jgi:hypothetical protein
MERRLALPPRKCPACLLGLCHRCTGRLIVLDVYDRGRDVPCRHEHPAGSVPTARVLAEIPGVVLAALTPDDPALPADPGGAPC